MKDIDTLLQMIMGHDHTHPDPDMTQPCRVLEEAKQELLTLLLAVKPETIKNINTDDSVTEDYEEWVANKLQHRSNLPDKIDGYNQALQDYSDAIKELLK